MGYDKRRDVGDMRKKDLIPPESELAYSRETMTKDDYVRLATFRFAIRRFLVYSQTNARKHGLTPQQHQALLSIRGFPDRDMITIGELADHLCLKHHSAVELVNRLSALGLVYRETSQDDRRNVLVGLTPTAADVLASLSANNFNELIRLKPFMFTLIKSLS
jgi:DNA-binding MarR family transcriptional regulator